MVSVEFHKIQTLNYIIFYCVLEKMKKKSINIVIVFSKCSPEAVPKRPGTPEVAQTYNNTALVLWKPADTKSPCSYTLERKTDGETSK